MATNENGEDATPAADPERGMQPVDPEQAIRDTPEGGGDQDDAERGMSAVDE